MSHGLPSEFMISTRFPIVDLAVSGALEGSEDLVEHVLTYDVGCEYIAKILARWDQWKLPPEQKKIIEELKILLPQMHILAHQESCQREYCLGYKQGCGQSNGETPEQGWAEHNAVGGCTKEMNGGCRHDIICDHFNRWNWHKNVTRGTLPSPHLSWDVLTRHIVTARYIASKIKELLLLQLKQTMDLAALTEEAGLEVVKQWLALEIDDQAPTPSTYKPRKTAKRSVFVLDETHGEVPSPFDCKIVD